LDVFKSNRSKPNPPRCSQQTQRYPWTFFKFLNITGYITGADILGRLMHGIKKKMGEDKK